ncbi:Dynein intermediate chain 2, ciliary [Eumeta japonica]|uniref:Dynein intermediate chain 2, ciliary n=1 Tax=Eumeta variegata TaxID=151549 RepID=A0A4C1T2Q2_EUMVA|nr:Dynein intermediate chain 2, ciliary [Eumeta japonica]
MLKAMVRRALKGDDETVLQTRALQCFEKEANKSRTTILEEGALDWMKPRVLLRPDDQEELTEADLDEEVARILTTRNPHWVLDEVAFHYGQGQFTRIPKPTFGKAFPLYVFQGTAIRKDSEEARAQIAAGYGMVGFDDAGPKRAKAKKTSAEEEEEDEPAAEAEASPEEAKAEEEAAHEEEEKEPDDVAGETEQQQEEAVGEEVKEGVDEETETVEKEAVEEQTEELFDEVIDIKPRVKKLANQFNFCERAALTYTCPLRTVETQSLPPARATYSATALQSIIFDYYQEDYEKKLREREEEKPKRLRKKAAKHAKSAQEIHDEQLAQRVREAWTVLERLVNQNIYDDIAQDYRYWDDPSDEFREGVGSLLPLWKFQYEPMRSHAVCDVQWNPHYQDLFAVAYGSLDFTAQQKEGCLCLYSIKNPAYPEYAVITESPVICLDVYREVPYLICIGCYDGNVCVYNSKLSLESHYQYKSDSVRDKHSNIVWEIAGACAEIQTGYAKLKKKTYQFQHYFVYARYKDTYRRVGGPPTEAMLKLVRWGRRLIDGEATFFSISGDGRVVQWAVMPGELQATTIITLRSGVPPVPGPDGTLLTVNGCGSCLCFHPEKAEIFMVGTEDGMIHTCSKAYSRDHVMSVKGHHMPVYRIHYNYFNNNVFISCSGDWRVKIWEDGRVDPLFMFELGSPVGDVRWAPYSSTVFAACTSDGKTGIQNGPGSRIDNRDRTEIENEAGLKIEYGTEIKIKSVTIEIKNLRLSVFVYDLNVNKYKPICVQAVVSKKLKKLTRIDFNPQLPVIVCGDTKYACVRLKSSIAIFSRLVRRLHSSGVMKLDKLLSLVRDPPITPGAIDEKFDEDD